jgi:ribonucleoside-diphosphate reductase alpha chain
MVNDKGDKPEIDYVKLSDTINTAVRFLDNVIDANKFPLPQIDKTSKKTRKIGLGIMGFADMLIQLSIPYNSEEALNTAEQVMKYISDGADDASCELAKVRGTFPSFKGSIYDTESDHKFRNASRTTIAPTGSLSILANCSSGIEPVFALSYKRHILDGEEFVEVNPYFKQVAEKQGFYTDELIRDLADGKRLKDIAEVPDEVKRVFVSAYDISPEWHVRMQAAFQKYTDSAVSKTVNFPNEASPQDIADVYLLSYHEKLKGITIYRDRSRDTQVLTIGDSNGTPREKADVLSPRKRPKVTRGVTERVSTGCGSLYVTVNFDEHGIAEVFTTLGKSGGCAAAQLEAISRLISSSLRSGIELATIVRHLNGIRCPAIAWEQGHTILSCADAIASVLNKYIVKTDEAGNESVTVSERNGTGICPECGGNLIHQEGCNICPTCGFTKCG